MLISGGRAALPGAAEAARVDLRVEGERISEIGPKLSRRQGEEVLDATGLLVLPGGIDPHVHFDTPGFTEREDFLHGSAEAARGGITTVIDMPCTSLPPVVTPEAFDHKLEAVRPLALVDYGFYGGVHGSMDDLEAELAALADKVLGFKAYLLSGMETFPRVTHEELGRAIAAAERAGRPLLLHAEDADYVAAATARILAARERRGGKATWDDYVDSRPEQAERVAVAAALALATGREPTLHVVHVGTADAAEAIAAAGATCETCAHYLAFTREDFASKGASLKTAPPVKGGDNRERLWALLAEGKVSFVTSDHAPARREEKRSASVWTDYGGIPGVGTTLPYLFSEGYLAGRLSLSRFTEIVSASAARRYGLWKRKGSLEVGKDADFLLMDPEGRTILSGSRLYSKGKDTPFEGMELRGSLRSTWVRGRKIYDAAADETAADAAVLADATAAAGTAGSRELGGIVAEAGCGKLLTWGCA